jgi:hypothetical protein
LKWIGWISLLIGINNLFSALTFPYRLQQKLRQFDIEVTRQILSDAWQGAWPGIVEQIVLGIAFVIAGVLILKRRKSGFPMWKWLCCISIVSTTLYFFFNGENFKDAFVWFLWWGIFGISLYVAKRDAAPSADC